METSVDFQKFPKIARLNRDIIITEKIDGTNAQILIEHVDLVPPDTNEDLLMRVDDFVLIAGSRRRWLTPTKDHFGFREWVNENKEELVQLGPGRHFGEWWGQGIQRKYGMHKKVFSLFNTHRWLYDRPACCDVVPVLYEGPFDQQAIRDTVLKLSQDGSSAARKYHDLSTKAEGVVVFHKHANQLFKVTIENDEIPKSLVKERE